MSVELTFAQHELDYLVSLDTEKESLQVEAGAVVVTEQLAFYIGISSGKIEADSESFFCISTKAPIYENMKDLQKGSTFKYGETKYSIEDVY